MKNYKYLLFDLDGTLTYSHPGIYNCIRYALKRSAARSPRKNSSAPASGRR
ncbi:MAG: hypothetical protein ACLRSW_05340 [Christensenellaceae bacterium]